MNESPKIIQNITTIRNSSNCRIYFNDSDFLIFNRDLVLKYNLTKAKQITQELLTSISAEQRKYNVKQAAYNYSTAKPRTRAQIRQKLKLKEFSHDEISYALDFLADYNLIDDRKYAENFIKSAIDRKHQGKRRLEAELMRRGVDREIIRAAIESETSGVDMLETARAAAEKKIRINSHKPIEKRRNSLRDYLLRQGFPAEIVIRLVKEYFPREDSLQ